MASSDYKELVGIRDGPVQIEGMLELPPDLVGVVLFAHGSGSSRLSPRNNQVAAALRDRRMGTLLVDLLTPAEDRDYETRFDIALLTERLYAAMYWLEQHPKTGALPVGLFGASTGAAAALQLAAMRPDRVVGLVSRGGRVDLAGRTALDRVEAPTLLIVGELDHVVVDLNRLAFHAMHGENEMKIIAGATHLFQEPGALDEVAALAAEWLYRHLAGATHRTARPPAGSGLSTERRLS